MTPRHKPSRSWSSGFSRRYHILWPAGLVGVTLAAAAEGMTQHVPPTTQEDPPTSQPAADPLAPPVTPALGEAVDFAHRMARTHGLQAFRAGGALRADVIVRYGDETVLDGTLTYHDATGRARLEMRDGALLVFDGEKAWGPAHLSVVFGPRFQLRTWSYFLTAPFKLSDPGTHLRTTGLKTLRGSLSETVRLTFDRNIGDSPDDWYVLYSDPQGQHLAAMAYIVTYGRTAREAEAAPYSVVFERHQRVRGALLPVQWSFHEWSDAQGPHGEPAGSATIANLQFVPVVDSDFEPEAGMVEDPRRTP